MHALECHSSRDIEITEPLFMRDCVGLQRSRQPFSDRPTRAVEGSYPLHEVFNQRKFEVGYVSLFACDVLRLINHGPPATSRNTVETDFLAAGGARHPER